MITLLPLTRENPDFSPFCARHSADELLPCVSVGRVGMFLPKGLNEKSKFPLLILIHGGGWSSKKVFPDQREWAGDYLGFLGRYYSEKGLLCASVDYRLVEKEGNMQDAFDDCVNAVGRLCEQKEYPVDADKVCVLGESAGGHLAACLAYMPSTAQRLIRAAVLVNPVTDLTDPKWERFAGGSPQKWSPVNMVKENAGALCPTLMLHGNADQVVSVRHSVLLHDCLAEKDTDAELKLLEGTDHAFLLAEYMDELGRGKEATCTAVRELDRWLTQKGYLK